MMYVNGNNFNFDDPIDQLPEAFLFDTVLDPTVPKVFTSVDHFIQFAHLARACIGHDGKTTIVRGNGGYAYRYTNLKYKATEETLTYRERLTRSSGQLASYADWSMGQDNRLIFIINSWQQPFANGENSGNGTISWQLMSEVVDNTNNCNSRTYVTQTSYVQSTPIQVSKLLSFNKTNTAVGTVGFIVDSRIAYADLISSHRAPPILLSYDKIERTGGVTDPNPALNQSGARFAQMVSGLSVQSTDVVRPNLLVVPKGDTVFSMDLSGFTVNDGLSLTPGERYGYKAISTKSFSIGL